MNFEANSSQDPAVPTEVAVLIIGAGPGGLSVAHAFKKAGQTDILIIDRGEVGQAWLEYPDETHLLSESSEERDENMIAEVASSEVFPHIPHPSHLVYQKYLAYVAEQLELRIEKYQTVVKVAKTEHGFEVTTNKVEAGAQPGTEVTHELQYRAKVVVWAAGQYLTPDLSLHDDSCYVHYAALDDEKLATLGDELVVIGGGNGATSVVLQLAKPGRKINLLVSRKYQVPEPIDCLWKENMNLVLELRNQGLVTIREHVRVDKINRNPTGSYEITCEDGQVLSATSKPIACTGFLPNIAPINQLVDEVVIDHDISLDLDENHQSKKCPGLYVAGCIGQLHPGEGFIRNFREFGSAIAPHATSHYLL